MQDPSTICECRVKENESDKRLFRTESEDKRGRVPLSRLAADSPFRKRVNIRVSQAAPDDRRGAEITRWRLKRRKQRCTFTAP